MKKIKLFTLLLTSLAIIGTGCLKDKDYDNHEYGINDPDASPVGVGFNQGTSDIVNTGLTLSSSAQLFDSAAVLISLLSGHPAGTDVHVNIAVEDSLVSHYNTVNGTDLVILDPSNYSIIPTAVIPAGKLNGIVVINVPNTDALSPDTSYGLGLRITSADAGYTVATNENFIVLQIAIKNQYDGDYHSNGYVYHPSNPRAIVNLAKTLTTINANTVKCALGDLGPQGYFFALQVDQTLNAQGFHDVTVTAAPGAAGAPYVMFTSGLPTTNPGYTPQWPRSAECNNVYDDATQEFRIRAGYVGGTGYRVSEEIIKRDP